MSKFVVLIGRHLEPLILSGQPTESILEQMSSHWLEPTALFSIFGSIILLIVISSSCFYIYQRRKIYRQFIDQLKILGLDPKEEVTLKYMVKRYPYKKALQVLDSTRVFDDMASQEMIRIIRSEGSIESKEDFVDTVYKIRTNTHTSNFIKDIQEETLS
jgi:hypothetical protein